MREVNSTSKREDSHKIIQEILSPNERMQLFLCEKVISNF